MSMHLRGSRRAQKASANEDSTEHDFLMRTYRDSFDQSLKIPKESRPSPSGYYFDGGSSSRHSCSRDESFSYISKQRNRQRRKETSSVELRTRTKPLHHSFYEDSSLRDGKMVNFARGHEQEPSNQDWDMGIGVRRFESTREYRGGYDYRDDVDSIDSWEEEIRRRRRRALVRQDRFPPLASSLRRHRRNDHGNPIDETKYSSRDDVSFEILDRFGRTRRPEKSRSSTGRRHGWQKEELNNAENKSYSPAAIHHTLHPDASTAKDSRESWRNRSSGGESWRYYQDQGGYSTASTIETDDGLSMDESEASRSPNPQLLNARFVPDLPHGYMQRNDGVVISIASSVETPGNNLLERYDLTDEFAEVEAEVAAQDVINDLRALGYNVDEKNGILGSSSDSGVFSHYAGDSPSNQSNINSEMKAEGDYGLEIGKWGEIQTPPALRRLHSAKSTCSSRSKRSIHRAKARTSPTSVNQGAPGGDSVFSSAKSQSSTRSKRTASNCLQSLEENIVMSHKQKNGTVEQSPESMNSRTRLSLMEIETTGKQAGGVSLATCGQASGEEATVETFPLKAKDAGQSSKLRTRGARNYKANEMLNNSGKMMMTRVEDIGSTFKTDGSSITSVSVRSDSSTPQYVFDFEQPNLNSFSVMGTFPNTFHAADTLDGSRRCAANLTQEAPLPNDGTREVVVNGGGPNTVVSDLSQQLSTGKSVLTAAPSLCPVTTMCDKFLYACHIAVFPSRNRDSHSQITDH